MIATLKTLAGKALDAFLIGWAKGGMHAGLVGVGAALATAYLTYFA